MRRQETTEKALLILSHIEGAPSTTEEVCRLFKLSFVQWKMTYKPAIREIAESMGMFVPRPTSATGYRYSVTDLWNHGDEPNIRDGTEFDVQDGYTRVKTLLAHIEAAKVGAVRTSDRTMSAALNRLGVLAEGLTIQMEGLAIDMGVELATS